MTNTTSSSKVTKREYFAMIREIVADREDLVKFIDHEVELLNKKNSYKSNKPSKSVVENAPIRDAVYKAICENGEPISVAELMTMAEFMEYPKGKISAFCGQLKKSGLIKSETIKKVNYYSPCETEDGE